MVETNLVDKLKEIDAYAQNLGLEGVSALGLPKKIINILGYEGLGSLISLSEKCASGSPLKTWQIGPKTAAMVQEAFCSLSGRPIEECKVYLDSLTAPKIKKEPESILVKLAEPFYREVGHLISGETTMFRLQQWNATPPTSLECFYSMDHMSFKRGSANVAVFSSGGYVVTRMIPQSVKESYVPLVLPKEMRDFMTKRTRIERQTVCAAFERAEAIGRLKSVTLVKDATLQELARLGPKTALFLAVGFGR